MSGRVGGDTRRRGDADHMQRALALARQGLGEGAMPIAAVLAKRGDVLAESFWKGAERGLLDHPDAVVLREVDPWIDFRSRRETTLYLTLEPCLMCMGTAMSFFLGRIVYAMASSADGASTVAEVWAPAAGHPSPRGAYAVPVVEGGVYEAEARQLVAQWLDGGATGAEADFARRLLGQRSTRRVRQRHEQGSRINTRQRRFPGEKERP